MKNQIELAKAIARLAHLGQKYDGADYVDTHVADVAARVSRDARATETLVATAWLHDVIEDSDFTANDLARFGVAPEIITLVVVLTKYPNENYESYMEGFKTNSLAALVKFHDSCANYAYGGRPKYAKNIAFLTPLLPQMPGVS